MNCWKSINITKEIGQNRLVAISILIGILSFIILYVPFSLLHKSASINQTGFLPFIAVLLLLPTIHKCMNILPLIIMKKRVKVYFRLKNIFFPAFNYYTSTHLTKKVSLIVGLTPTLFITIPGLVASSMFPEYYVYLLLLTCFHLGMSFIDFLYILHIVKAPKQAFIQNVDNGFDILLKKG